VEVEGYHDGRLLIHIALEVGLRIDRDGQKAVAA
jgi:hypothetical protein